MRGLAPRGRRAAIYLRANAPWRRALPNRTVRRRVQGVDLYLPWSHLLPDFARACPGYGQNLVELAAGLHAGQDEHESLSVLDIGANVGDSAAQILARTAASVLCVEGDPYWAQYLRRNLGSDSRVTIVEAFLSYPDAGWRGATPVRAHGTTHFVEDAASRVEVLPIDQLPQRYPAFRSLRLAKTDTDGLDVALAPAIAQVWQESAPVIFFEFDPQLARNAGFVDPDEVWPRLAQLGYSRAAVWDNGGTPLGQFDVADGRTYSPALAAGFDDLGYYFWDVAVRRADDAAASTVFDRLVPQPFPDPGVR